MNEPIKIADLEDQVKPDDRAMYVAGLRQLASFYANHPEIPLPQFEHSNFALNDKEEATNLASALGTFQKKYTDDLLIVSKKFGNIEAKFYFTRDQVCTAKVVGQKYEPERVIPATIIPGRTVDIIEWDCHALNVPKGQGNG